MTQTATAADAGADTMTDQPVPKLDEFSKPDLLFLAHRIPYPPNKGDKIRSWNILKHLAKTHAVHLGCFIDDPEDATYIPVLQELCASTHFVRIHSKIATLKSAQGLLTGQALTFPYYGNRSLSQWVKACHKKHNITAQFVYSAAVAQFLPKDSLTNSNIRTLIDFVDVDSDKWAQYAPTKPWPLSWVYQREADKLAEAEKTYATAAHASVLVSPAEAALFRTRTELGDDKILSMSNGVDLQHYNLRVENMDNPYPANAPILCFTGAMDYWPNVEGALWFARYVLPRVLEKQPDAQFWIVGSKPDAKLTALAAQNKAITVTGRVEDIRPYILHATLSVAPLRIARGIQNKVLEAMATRKAVLATPQAFEGIAAEPGRDLMVEENPALSADIILSLINDEAKRKSLGINARAIMEARYSWDAQLRVLDHLLG